MTFPSSRLDALETFINGLAPSQPTRSLYGEEPDDDPGDRLVAAVSQLPWTPHLTELRARILIAFSVWLGACLLAFLPADRVINQLKTLAPATVQFIQITPGEVLWTSCKIAVLLGTALSAPVILYHVCRFVLPGLIGRERRWLLASLAAGPLLFLAGAGFGYWLVLPQTFDWLFTYGAQVAAIHMSIGAFASFCIGLLVLLGILFELPMVLVILATAGIVTTTGLVAQWRSVLLGSVLAAAILTPSQDPFTMLLVAGALCALFALTCIPLKLMGK